MSTPKAMGEIINLVAAQMFRNRRRGRLCPWSRGVRVKTDQADARTKNRVPEQSGRGESGDDATRGNKVATPPRP